MFPFPATLHGEPVRVFHFTEDRFACIALANGRIDYVPATSLVVPAHATLGDLVRVLEEIAMLADQIRASLP